MSQARARLGVSLLFFTNGAIFTNIVPRLPKLKHSFALTDGTYGFIIALISVGSLLAVTVTVPLIKRFGPINVASYGSTVLCACAAQVG